MPSHQSCMLLEINSKVMHFFFFRRMSESATVSFVFCFHFSFFIIIFFFYYQLMWLHVIYAKVFTGGMASDMDLKIKKKCKHSLTSCYRFSFGFFFFGQIKKTVEVAGCLARSNKLDERDECGFVSCATDAGALKLDCVSFFMFLCRFRFLF